MSSLLRPVVLESCQTNLRERRRSSINPLTVVPRLFSSGQSSIQDGSAIMDEDDPPQVIQSARSVAVPPLSTLKHAQLPDHASKIMIPRHYGTLPVLNTYDITSPTSSSPPTAFDSRKASLESLSVPTIPDVLTMERLRWRLASGFFAYFLCGWGDGGT